MMLDRCARRVLVGIIDSGIGHEEPQAMLVADARQFAEAGDGSIQSATARADSLGHGSTIAQIVCATHRAVDLLIAQVFAEQRSCSPRMVAAAIDWLVASGAAVVNMSFGIRHPDAELRLACERAYAAGVILVCAAPARGGPVFPSAYPFCIAVAGDARCRETEISWLGTAAIDFGASPHAIPGSSGSGGASFAVARITARVADLLGRGLPPQGLSAALRSQCRYRGPERRVSAATIRADRVAPPELS
jgi:hypothetical protein